MVAFVEVLVVWSRFWRIYERGFVDLVEGTTKRMALLFGRKTIGENLILETSIVVVIRLSWKAIFQTCRNNNSKCKPFQTRNKTISNSLRDSFRANILANHQLSLKYQHKKKKGKKNPQRIENELEPTCQSLRKISCPSTQSSRHSKQSDAAPPIVRLCPATVSQSSPICACENEADRKKIRDRIRIKITLPLLLHPIISAVSSRFPITSCYYRRAKVRTTAPPSSAHGWYTLVRVFYREAKKQSKHLPPGFERLDAWKRIPSHGE